MFLTAVRLEVYNLESYVVVQELELAINLSRISNKFCVIGVLWSFGNQYNVGTLSWFSLAFSPECRAV